MKIGFPLRIAAIATIMIMVAPSASQAGPKSKKVTKPEQTAQPVAAPDPQPTMASEPPAAPESPSTPPAVQPADPVAPVSPGIPPTSESGSKSDPH
ncbi:hypothetical protein [Novosphingobium sp.]|uniref:hypothetical protein n=1 Tax=Novosphingobium sp. TaxID=1874826 RepID=UPI0025EB7529|nr:hypothetical protein [Novosphingobium sp.]